MDSLEEMEMGVAVTDPIQHTTTSSSLPPKSSSNSSSSFYVPSRKKTITALIAVTSPTLATLPTSPTATTPPTAAVTAATTSSAAKLNRSRWNGPFSTTFDSELPDSPVSSKYFNAGGFMREDLIEELDPNITELSRDTSEILLDTATMSNGDNTGDTVTATATATFTYRDREDGQNDVTAGSAGHGSGVEGDMQCSPSGSSSSEKRKENQMIIPSDTNISTTSASSSSSSSSNGSNSKTTDRRNSSENKNMVVNNRQQNKGSSAYSNSQNSTSSNVSSNTKIGLADAFITKKKKIETPTNETFNRDRKKFPST